MEKEKLLKIVLLGETAIGKINLITKNSIEIKLIILNNIIAFLEINLILYQSLL